MWGVTTQYLDLYRNCSFLRPKNCLQGINATYDKKKILKALKKEYCCNGTVVEDDELGQVIQVQGDQRKNIADFLTNVSSQFLFVHCCPLMEYC
jgi:translation initiation factor SUI1